MSDEQFHSLGARLRELREQAGLSIRQLALRVGVHHSYLAYLVRQPHFDLVMMRGLLGGVGCGGGTIGRGLGGVGATRPSAGGGLVAGGGA
jgi:hypothetical protein